MAHGMPFLETSAYTAENVYALFEQVVLTIQDKIENKEIKMEVENPGIKHGNANYSNSQVFNVDHKQTSNKKKSCC